MWFKEIFSSRRLSKQFIEQVMEINGFYTRCQIIRNGIVIDDFNFKNGITIVGKNYLLDVGFNTGTQIASGNWCMGLINAASFSALNEANTMASHGGWVEFTTYTQSTRVAWPHSAAASKAIVADDPCTFTIGTVSGVSLKGAFITSNSTKGGTTGTLWSTGQYAADKAIETGDTINTNYGIQL